MNVTFNQRYISQMLQLMAVIPKIYWWFQLRCTQQPVLLHNCVGLQFNSQRYTSQNLRGLHQALERCPLGCILSLTISTASRASIDGIQVNSNNPGPYCDIYSFASVQASSVYPNWVRHLNNHDRKNLHGSKCTGGGIGSKSASNFVISSCPPDLTILF